MFPVRAGGRTSLTLFAAVPPPRRSLLSRAKATLTDMLLSTIILYDYTTNLLQMQPLFFTIFRPFIRRKVFLRFQRELTVLRLRLFRSKPRPFRGHSPHFHLYKCWEVFSFQNRRQHYPSNPVWIRP